MALRGQWGVFEWGRQSWAQIWWPDFVCYPDQIPVRRSLRRNMRGETYTEVVITPPTIDALTAIYTKQYDDIVPKFKHRIYLHPTDHTRPPLTTEGQQGIEWQPEYPDFIISRNRMAYLVGGMAPKSGHTARTDAAVDTMAELFGGDWPDYIPPNKKRAAWMSSFIAPTRTPASLWTEPAITAISTTWTEPALSPTVQGAVTQ